MKKTLVAVAAMAAVTGAMADAVIYGTVDTHITSTKTTTNTIGLSGAYSGNALGFKGSEDIGSGMKANYQIELYPGYFGAGGTSTQTLTNYQSFAGISGDFGTLRAGQFFNMGFFNNAMGDATGISNAGGFQRVSENGTGTNQNNSVEYTLPNMISGLGVTVGKTFDNGTYAATTTDGASAVMSQSYRVTYSAGAFNTGYSVSKAATATGGAMTAKGTSFSANYDFGVAKLFGNYQTYSTTTTATNMGLSIPFNQFSLNYNYGYKTVSGTKTDGYNLQGIYAFSKNTKALVQYAISGTTTVTAVGMQVNF